MSEFKTHEDYMDKALYILSTLGNKLDISVLDNRIIVKHKRECVALLAGELLDVYKEGWDERSTCI